MSPTLHPWIAFVPTDAEHTAAHLADYLIGGDQPREFAGKDCNYYIARLGTDVYQIGETLDSPAIRSELGSLIIRDNERALRVLDLTQSRSPIWVVDNSEVEGTWSTDGVPDNTGFDNWIQFVDGNYHQLPAAAVLV